MGGIFHDAEQFESYFTRLFGDVDAAGGMEPLTKAGLIVRFEVRDPDVEMWIDGSMSPVETSFGPSDLRAALTARMTGDSLHELLLGTLPLGRALSSGKLKVKGSFFKARRLEGLFHSCQAIHPELSQELLGQPPQS